MEGFLLYKADSISNPTNGENFADVKNMIYSHPGLQDYIGTDAEWGPPDPLTDLPVYMRKTPTRSCLNAGLVVRFIIILFPLFNFIFNSCLLIESTTI